MDSPVGPYLEAITNPKPGRFFLFILIIFKLGLLAGFILGRYL